MVGAAVLGTVALATPAAQAEVTTLRERGTVMTCSGQWLDRPVVLTVHEQHSDVRVLVLAVGEGEQLEQLVRTPGHRLVRDRGVHERGWLAGHRFDLAAVVVRDGDPVPVHAEHDDGDQHVVVDGAHQPLAATATFTWRHRATTLARAGAFRYDHTVTRTDAEPSA